MLTLIGFNSQKPVLLSPLSCITASIAVKTKVYASLGEKLGLQVLKSRSIGSMNANYFLFSSTV